MRELTEDIYEVQTTTIVDVREVINDYLDRVRRHINLLYHIYVYLVEPTWYNIYWSTSFVYIYICLGFRFDVP